ncbi:hypothetical protein B0J18DRAFT_372814 [Chaetomium sp. MPI-SDFR-AT-0129]|nr:hypothetical protein B0J18DRAFT_372814 [Chaetomium sp. MPI-SDFR-AT-0129]
MASLNTSPNNLPKAEGDISDSFASLSGRPAEPLPDRFRELKLRLVQGHEDAVVASWKRLLAVLRKENDLVARMGPAIIPEVRFSHFDEDLKRAKADIEKRGVAVIRGVIPEDEARAYKFEIEEYVRQNPQTRGFPQENPQVFELYWSPTQTRARTHPNLLTVQRALMANFWHTSPSKGPNPDTPKPSQAVSLHTPLAYADRLRIRQPGDAHFALGPHQDGGSVERWEEFGYGNHHLFSSGGGHGVYDAVFRGEWDAPLSPDSQNGQDGGGSSGGYDPFNATARASAVTDLYNGLGACSMFRMFQGWLAMSESGPGRGTLLVNPLVKEAAVYALLRPFFRARRGLGDGAAVGEGGEKGWGKGGFLEEENWEFTGGEKMTSDLQGAVPGCGQEFPEGLHPHLELERTMVHVPEVRPGDYVVWHCDTIHAVDRKHNGTGDSSVLYIPVCPTTKGNAEYAARQRDAFLRGTPGPDFPGGEGESRHIGRATEEYVKKHCTPAGVQTLALEQLPVTQSDTVDGKAAVAEANKTLGFS